VDETTETTVQKPIRIIAKKGVKQVGKMASSERVFWSPGMWIQARVKPCPAILPIPKEEWQE